MRRTPYSVVSNPFYSSNVIHCVWQFYSQIGQPLLVGICDSVLQQGDLSVDVQNILVGLIDILLTIDLHRLSESTTTYY